MFLDKQALLSDLQALSGTGAVLSTNTIDLGAPGTMALNGQAVPRDLGKGFPTGLLVQVAGTTAPAGGTSLAVEVVQADDAALSSGLEVLATTPAIPLASLTVGYQFALSSLPLKLTKRYLGLRYQRVGTFTAGAVTGGIILDRQAN